MIKTVDIKNFRCFESVHLSDCRRINIIVGRNASGKTALLEALFIASGVSPELTIKIKNWRGQAVISLTTEQASYETIWKDLFHNFNQNQEISIRFCGSPGFDRSLRILYEPKAVITVPIGADTGIVGQEILPLTFIYQGEDKKEYRSSIRMTQAGFQMDAIPLLPIQGNFIGSLIPIAQQQYARFFSDLSIQKREQEIIGALQREFSFIESIGVEAGDLLFASVKHLLEKVQVGVLSAGIYKLLCMLLSISRQPRGVIFIDEIENGFYFDRLQNIWSMILHFADKYEVQVFASTHSRECLEAAADVAKQHYNDFMVFRTVRVDGKAELRHFDGKRLVDAMNEGIEIR